MIPRPLPTAVTVLALALPGRAWAAGPTTAECLDASDASLRFGNEHRLTAERTQLLLCASPSCPAEVRKECTTRAVEVAEQIPTVVFVAKDTTGADVTDVQVTLDGQAVADHLDGTAMAIDPGDHVLTFEAPGHAPVHRTLVVVEGQKGRQELVTFGAAPPAVPPVRALSAQQDVALIAGALGVIGLGIGTVFGVVAATQKNDAQSACPGVQCSTQDAVNKWSSAKTTGDVSTVAFVAGGAGLIAGAVLWISASRPDEPARTSIGLSPGGVRIAGVW